MSHEVAVLIPGQLVERLLEAIVKYVIGIFWSIRAC